MKKKNAQLGTDELRGQAEEQLKQQPVPGLPESPTDGQLLHELQVHQIELEMQNEELRRTEMELELSQARYFDLFDLAPVGYLALDEKGLIVEANLTAAAQLGVTRSALVRQLLTRFILPEDRDIHYLLHRQLFEKETRQVYELRMLRAGAGPFWARLEATVAEDAGGATVCRAVLVDITQEKQAEMRLRRLNRALQVLNECNQVLVHTDTEAEFLQKMCETIVNVGEYRMAWIGFAQQDPASSVWPAAQVGFEDGYLGLAQISWADTERGRGPTGTAIREGVAQVNQNFLTNPKMKPWREAALLRGYQASIALPLKNEDATFGALTIYAASPDAFDKDEVHLLTQLANDLAFGIHAARGRAGRKRAEAAVRQLSSIVEQTEDTVMVTDRDGVIEYVNPAFERLTGYTREEAVGRKPSILKSGVQDDPFYKGLWKTILEGGVFLAEIANRRKDGGLFYEAKTITPLRDAEGRITHFAATGKDITGHKRDEEKLRKAYDELELRVQQRTAELSSAVSKLENEVAERKQAEAALQESEKKYRDLVQFAPAGIYEVNSRTRKFTSVNDVMCSMLGYTREELLDMSPSDIMDQDSQALFMQRTRKWLAGEKQDESVEYRIKTKAGREICVLLNVTFTRDEHASPLGATVVAYDITERKQMEEALRHSEERFRLALKNAPVSVAAQDRDLRFLWAYNQRAVDPNAVIGKTDMDLFAPEDAAHLMALKRRVFETEKELCEQLWITSGGQRVYLNLFIEPLRDETGRVTGIGIATVDLTSMKLTEEALCQSEELFSKVFHAGPVAINLFRLSDGRSVDANDTFVSLTGYSREEIVGRTAAELNLFVSPEQRRVWMQTLQESGSSRNQEAQLRQKSGAVVDALVSMVSVEVNGEAMVIVLAVDITERKQAEAEIQKYVNELRSANDELIRFNRAMVGRELRMIELKKEVNALCGQAGQPARYPTNFETDAP